MNIIYVYKFVHIFYNYILRREIEGYIYNIKYINKYINNKIFIIKYF